ncbi:MAG: BamA/TamA family outer membrane protein [Ignavibacteriaceae bacterium]|nr:BamA/TamA family outer membrane protein [Ignavibacteriaceae bacterium]
MLRLFLFIAISINLYPFKDLSDSVAVQTGIFLIDSIKISGNDITDNDIILGELTFAEGDFVDSLSLDFNRKRVFSLRLFTSVEFEIENKNNFNILNILVKESWYIYPVPFIDRREKDWTKISYGIDVKIQNFRGRNEFLMGRVGFGYDPHFLIAYNVPYLFRKEQISFGVDVSYSTRKNRSLTAEGIHGGEFNQNFFDIGLSVGRRFGIFHITSVYGGFRNIQTPFYAQGISAGDSEVERYGFLGVRYNYDSRNLRPFPTSGNYIFLSTTYNGIGSTSVSYYSFTFDFRDYRLLIGNFGVKWKIEGRELGGAVVPYRDFAILGLDERIRGRYYDRSEGVSLYAGSIEFFQPIFMDYPFEIDLPVIPSSLTRYRMGLSVHAFIDAGFTRMPGEPYSLDKAMVGYGFGITVLALPYSSGRAEIGFNSEGKAQLILDTWISF